MEEINIQDYLDNLTSAKHRYETAMKLKRDLKEMTKGMQRTEYKYGSKEYIHNMYEKHKEKVLKYMNRDVVCECGQLIKYSNNKHKFTNKHYENLEKKRISNISLN